MADGDLFSLKLGTFIVRSHHGVVWCRTGDDFRLRCKKPAESSMLFLGRLEVGSQDVSNLEFSSVLAGWR